MEFDGKLPASEAERRAEVIIRAEWAQKAKTTA